MTTQRMVNTFDQKTVYQLQRFMPDKKKKRKHIVICEIGVHELMVLLRVLVHDEAPSCQRQLVILNTKPPSTAISLFLSDPKNAPFLTYIEGSPLSAKDLSRACMHEACACFIFSGETQDLESSSSEVKVAEDFAFFCLFSVLDYRTYRNQEVANFVALKVSLSERARTFKSVLRSSFPEYLNPSRRIASIVCTDDIKLRMAANSCMCPGFSSFITNLLMPIDASASTIDLNPSEPQPDWLTEYLEGSQYKLFTVTLSDIFHNVLFSEAARIIHEVTGMLLFAVAVGQRRGNGPKRCIVNPTNFKFPASERLLVEGYVLAKCLEDAQLLEDEKLGSRKGAGASYGFYGKSFKVVHKSRESMRGQLQTRLIKGVKRQARSKKEVEQKKEQQHGNDPELQKHLFNILRLDGDLALEWYTFARYPRTIIEATIESDLVNDFPKVRGHIVLLSSHFELTEFILPLRRKSQTEHKSIVILCSNLPNDLEWSKLAQFTDIYLFQGSSNDIQALDSCGVRYASSVVILRDRARAKNDEDSFQTSKKSLDTLNLLSYNSVHSINPCVRILCEVSKQESIAILQKRLVANDTTTAYNSAIPFNLWNVFASGNLHYSHITSAIASLHYKNPRLSDIVSRLVHGVDFENLNQWNGDVRAELPLNFQESNMYELHLKQCERKTYGFFLSGLAKLGILPFAIRRGILQKLKFGMKGNKMPYVLTNPPADTAVYRVDSLLCFAPTNPFALIFGPKTDLIDKELKGMIAQEAKTSNTDILNSVAALRRKRRAMLSRGSEKVPSAKRKSSLVGAQVTTRVQERLRKHSSLVIEQLGDLQGRIEQHYGATELQQNFDL